MAAGVAQGIGAVAAGLAFIAIGSAFGALVIMGAQKISADETGLETWLPEGMKAPAGSEGARRGRRDRGQEPSNSLAHNRPVIARRDGDGL